MNSMHLVHSYSQRMKVKHIFLFLFPIILLSGRLLSAEPVTTSEPKNTLGEPLTYAIEAYSTLDAATDIELLQNSGKLMVETIKPGTLPNFKYTSKIIWLKVDLEFINPAEGPYMGVIDYPPIDSVLIASYQDEKELGKRWLGDHHAHANLNYRKPSFKLSGSETHLWIRIQSATSVQFPLSIHKEIDFFTEKQVDSVEQSLYYGALISIFIYNLILAFSTKFKMYRYYIGFLFSYGLFQAIFSGYGVSLLWPAAPTFWIDKSLTFFISLVGLFSYLFAFSLLDLKQTSPKYYRIGRIILYLHAPHIVILWLVSYKVGIFWVFLLAFVWSSYLIFISIRLSLRKNRIALIYLIAWFVFILGTMVGILLTFNILPRNFFTVYSQQIGSVLEFILLSFTMAYKINQIDEQRKVDLESQVEKQTAKLRRVQYLSQEIQNTSDFDRMIHNLSLVLEKEFAIPAYYFYRLDEERNRLDVLRLVYNFSTPEIDKETMSFNSLDLSHPNSQHAVMIRRGKPCFLPRILNIQVAPDEERSRELVGMKSMYFLPLKVDGKVFAVLTMSDTKYQKNDRVKYLTREERADLELLSQFVSSALYQALQKEQIEKAKNEAEQAQVAISRAKNEAAVNQLAAHLAHEVNNPLNYIATGKIMQNDSFSRYHQMILGVLSGDDEETNEFKAELDKLQKKFDQGMQQTNEGQDRIAKVVSEIRAITGLDGLNFSTFDLVPIINEELVYSLHRNKIKIKEQAIKVTGTDKPIHVLSNSHILARSIRTVISNCIYFARTHKGDDGELYIHCKIREKVLYIDIGNNSFSIKTIDLDDLFNLEKSQSYGSEQIGLAMIKELLVKVNSKLILADHGRESGKVIFQLQVPLDT